MEPLQTILPKREDQREEQGMQAEVRPTPAKDSCPKARTRTGTAQTDRILTRSQDLPHDFDRW